MNDLNITLLRLINGLFTLSYFPLLYSIYDKTQKRFYLLWGAGFLLYGVNIIIRTGFLYFDLNALDIELIPFMFLLTGFTLILTGIGELINRAKTLLLASLIVPLIIAILYFTVQTYYVGQIIAQIPYFFICVSLLYIRVNFSASLDLFLVGWVILSLTNIGAAFELIDKMYVEVFAIFGKIVLLIGITYPKFSFLVDDLRRFLISGLPYKYITEYGDKLVLVNSKSGNRNTETQWITDRIKDNSEKSIKTVLITTYDLISPSDLATVNVSQELFYVVRMIQGGKSMFDIFTEHMMTINDDLNDLDILVTDIINFTNDTKTNCQIILYNLSSLIHTHGWKRVYTFLLSKISLLKSSNVNLYALYYHKTHEIESDIAKFETIADKISEI